MFSSESVLAAKVLEVEWFFLLLFFTFFIRFFFCFFHHTLLIFSISSLWLRNEITIHENKLKYKELQTDQQLKLKKTIFFSCLYLLVISEKDIARCITWSTVKERIRSTAETISYGVFFSTKKCALYFKKCNVSSSNKGDMFYSK